MKNSDDRFFSRNFWFIELSLLIGSQRTFKAVLTFFFAMVKALFAFGPLMNRDSSSLPPPTNEECLLANISTNPFPGQCGRFNFSRISFAHSKTKGRVLNGHPAKRGLIPWQVRLRKSDWKGKDSIFSSLRVRTFMWLQWCDHRLFSHVEVFGIKSAYWVTFCGSTAS